MPLALAPKEVELTIKRIGLDDKTKSHLSDLGVSLGSRVKVLSESGGSVILVVKDGRLCIDKMLAAKILVA